MWVTDSTSEMLRDLSAVEDPDALLRVVLARVSRDPLWTERWCSTARNCEPTPSSAWRFKHRAMSAGSAVKRRVRARPASIDLRIAPLFGAEPEQEAIQCIEIKIDKRRGA
jgi:hypothetical protein